MERYKITHTTENFFELQTSHDGIYLNFDGADDVFNIMLEELSNNYNICGRYMIKMETVDAMGNVISIVKIYDSDK